MKFFLPYAKDRAEAESVMVAISKFIGVPVPERRIFRLSYTHNGMDFDVEVGQPIPAYYREHGQVVIAIFGGDPYCICLANRGVARGVPIYAGQQGVRAVEYFDPDEDT